MRTYWHYSIAGVVPEAKGNSRRISKRGRGGPLYIRKGEKAEAFVETFGKKLWAQHVTLYDHTLPFDAMFGVCGRIVYPDWRRDLDPSLIYDVLQSTHIIPDDRRIRSTHWWAAEVSGTQYGIELFIYIIGRWFLRGRQQVAHRCMCGSLGTGEVITLAKTD